MDTLPKNMTYELALKVDEKDLKSYFETVSGLDPEKGQWYFETAFWGKIAHRDYGFPEHAFPFTGKRFMEPHLRYKFIQQIIPSQKKYEIIK